MLPVKAFVYQGYRSCPASADQDCVDRHTQRVFPVICDRRCLGGRSCKAGVGVCRFGLGALDPVFALPVDQVVGCFSHTFPVNVTVISQSDVGENCIFLHRGHGCRVGLPAGSGGNAEETGFGIDGVESAVRAEAHPGDVVTDCLHFPVRESRQQHGQIGLAAG